MRPTSGTTAHILYNYKEFTAMSKRKKGFVEAVHGEKVALELIGFPKGYYYRYVYDNQMLDTLTRMVVNKMYRTNPLAMDQSLEIMMVAIGTNCTTCTKLKKDGHGIDDEAIIAMFESLNLPFEEVRNHLLTLAYNSQRSTFGNLKSLAQKIDVDIFCKKLSDPFCRLKICEPSGSGLTPKPDGYIALDNGEAIWVYLRYGDSTGGSQGDRRSTMLASEKHGDKKFIFIWDGIEVNQKTLNAINAASHVYATRLADFDESVARQKLLN